MYLTDTGIASCTFHNSTSWSDLACTNQCQNARLTAIARHATGLPLASASLTTHRAALSLTDPPGFMNSACVGMFTTALVFARHSEYVPFP